MRTFEASLPELNQMMDWVRETLKQFGLGPNPLKKFEVAIEEALVNIIEYAYQQKPGTIEIRFQENSAKKEIVVILVDQGLPFDPIHQAETPDITASLQDRKEGGLGIYLMKKLVDHIDYQRVGNSNILTMTKVLS